MEQRVRRGDIFLADLDPVRGSEQAGRRPVLVLQNNTGNSFGPTVIVAAITTHARQLPTHVELTGVVNLAPGSFVLMEQVRTIDKKRLVEYLDTVHAGLMIRVDVALFASMGLGRYVRPPMELCLCESCKRDHMSAGFRVYRMDPHQKVRDTCTFCSRRSGYDYVMITAK